MHENLFLKTILFWLEDLQAQEITVIDVHTQTAITDYMVICNGRSSRHVRSIAERVMEEMKAAGMPAISNHGRDSGSWVLIDFGDVILHIMQPESRTFYYLEGIWQNAKE